MATYWYIYMVYHGKEEALCLSRHVHCTCYNLLKENYEENIVKVK